MVKLFDDEQDQQLAPKPIDLSQDLRSTVEARTISEDTEAVGDIAAGLLRAYQGQAAETGGPPQITDVDQLTRRATDIERAIERLPGEEDALGLARTTFSIGKFFVDNIVGVANTIAVPLGLVDTSSADPDAKETLFTKPQKQYEKERYVKFYNEQIDKFDRNIANAAIRTAYKIFDESPELKNEGEFVKGVIDRLAGQVGTITAREADEITGYWRPEASTTEQVVRAIPEFVGITAAGVKFFSRGSKKIIKEFEDTLGKSVLKASEDEIRDTTVEMMNKAVFPIANALKLGGIRKTLYGKRVAANLRLRQMPTRFVEANKKIEAARNKVRAARTKGDKNLLAREEAA